MCVCVRRDKGCFTRLTRFLVIFWKQKFEYCIEINNRCVCWLLIVFLRLRGDTV